MSVKDFMTKDLVTVTPKTKIFDAVDLIKKYDIHRLPVIDNDKLVGLITEANNSRSLTFKGNELERS